MDRLLAQLSQSLDRARTLDELARPLLEMLQTVTGLESTYLTEVDEAAGEQHILFSRNTGTIELPEGLTVPWADTLCRRALEEGRTQCDDVPARWGDSDAAAQLGLQTYVSVPVRMGDGALFGTLCAASAERHVLDTDAENVLRLFAHLIGYHIERERMIDQLRRANAELATSALSDALTGLPNRRSLEQELARMLARAQRDDRALVVAFIDLDGFKTINDQHGHDAGDRFLIAMARALESVLRGGDLVARIGGDEFVVAGIVPRENPEAAAKVLCDRLADATVGQFDLGDGRRVDYAGASVGVVLARTGEIDAGAIIDRADRAMYQTKRERRGLRS
ncbi:sensor domain-containing diguanylate cyclase [Lysobacter sp. TY2-98]|uniref:GGDEF domain-containing protein n=1 Tax=Lysobacter sp. TY2-98 TaxID=2290922 RepID=UPI000E207E7D|nr:sensor domain-containing diguanylate cyclase [Lysobacter sp. TY2-98]AXK72085.1 sensor domain-containing diguanylate cyclase [Lysobacter sp. TY2-98]